MSNEGNARMVATLPPIHIALMGMERIVPKLDDLALMLSLLPRSATGQKLSVYTQILQKPLAGQTRHIIILDNGRSRLRNSPLKESLYCIRCGACLNACPVFRELGGHAYVGNDNAIAPYPGPIGAVISPGLLGNNFVQLAQASSLCGACKDACPVDIDLPKMLIRVRAGMSEENAGTRQEGQGLSALTKFLLWMYSRVARSPRLFAASQKFAFLGGTLFALRSSWIRLPAFTGWGYSKDFPQFARKTFRERYVKKSVTESDRQANTETGRHVSTQTGKPVDDLVVQFTSELTALSGHVYRPQNATAEIVEFLKLHEIDRIHLEPNTLDESVLMAARIDFTHEPDTVRRVGVTPHVSLDQKWTCGVTKALCGLADTGTVLVADGAGSPLHASLLPEIHIAVLNVSDILPSLPDAMHLVRDQRAAAFITGPSRTADIEMTLTIGVHGPREIHVFLVP